MSGAVIVVGVPGITGRWYVAGQSRHLVRLSREPGAAWTLVTDERHVVPDPEPMFDALVAALSPEGRDALRCATLPRELRPTVASMPAVLV